MHKKIKLSKFIYIVKNNVSKKDIKLVVEGKKLRSGENIVNVKSLIVSEKLFNDLGLKAKGVVVKKKNTKNRITLADVMKEIVSIKTNIQTLKTNIQTLKTDVKILKTNVNILKADVQAMKNTPTMKKELEMQEGIS